MSGHDRGFVVQTTEHWRARVDPHTTLRLQNRDGAWTSAIHGHELHVDAAGLWIDQSMALEDRAEELEIAGAWRALIALVEASRPPDGALVVNGDRVRMSGANPTLRAWLGALRTALDQAPQIGPDPRLVVRARAEQGGWAAVAGNVTFREMLAQPVFRRSGWAWDDIARIEVENVSGLKTLGGIALGSTLLGLIAIPALLAVTPAANAPSRPSTSRAGYRLTDASLHTPSPRGAWSATPAPAASLHAPSMFSTRAVVSAWLRPHVVLDGSAALAGDHIASGIVARLRIGELIELGGGMRTSLVRFDDAWRRSTQGLFTGNVHLPIDAARRFALLVGVEAGGGGAIALDVKVPSLGLRYASSSGRVFASLSPAAPQYLRRDDAPGRWSLASTAELGLSF